MSNWKVNKSIMKNNPIDPNKIRNQPNKLYKSVFKNLTPRTTYWDPLGAKTGQKGWDLRRKWYDEEKELLEYFDYLHAQRGFSVGDSIDQIQKQVIETGAWNLPIHFLPEIRVVNPERTPFADMLPRVAFDQETYNVTARTDQNEDDVGWDLEPDEADDQLENYRYPMATPNFDDYDWEVVQYGLSTAVSDVMQLTSRTIRDPTAAAEQNLARSMRLAEEYQITLGEDTNGMNNDGFYGILDFGTEHATTAPGNMGKEDFRDLIDTSIENGANPQSLMVVTNFDSHRLLRNELDDFVRYEVPDANLDFGAATFTFDGVPVFRSQAMGEETDHIHTAVVDAERVYMAMVQDLNIPPIAKIGTVDEVAMSAIGVLVCEDGDENSDSPTTRFIEGA